MLCNPWHLCCLAACAADGPHFRLHLQNTPHHDVLLTVHISGYICRTHHTMMCCIYQTKSAASNLQFGPTKRRVLSAAVDTASRAVGHTKAWPTPLLLPTPQPHPLGRGLSPYRDALGTALSRWWL